MRASTVYLTVGCVLVTFVLSVWIAKAGDADMRVIANTVNLGGAALTFAGLSYAYIRSDVHLREWFRTQWRRLTGHHVVINVDAASMVLIGGSAHLQVIYGFADESDDPIERLHARTERLLQIVNDLSDELTKAEVRIHDLDNALEQARIEAREGDQRTRADAEAAIDRFAQRLNRSQVLDLRWAIAGVFFSMFGAVLSFYA